MAEIRRAIAMGFFDGFHIGHAALIEKTKQRALELECEPSVLSFDVHPDNVIFNIKVPLISDCPGRKEIAKRCFDIDSVIFIHFNRHVMQMAWQEFADTIISEMGAVWFVVGHDFTFGSRGEGTAEKLKEYCGEKGIGCDIIPPVTLDGRIVSSTYIRTLIEDGNMEEAARYLGHRHCLSDTVHSGYHIGRKLEAPTINMYFPENVIVPKHGVYATKVILPDGTEYPSVTNIGIRPTVSDENIVSVESHLLNFSGNLYGTPARVDFYHFIRPEQKFASFEELSAVIKQDAAAAEKYFSEKQDNSITYNG